MVKRTKLERKKSNCVSHWHPYFLCLYVTLSLCWIHSPFVFFSFICCLLLWLYIFFLLSPLMSLPFSSFTDPSTSSHLLLLPHHYSSFSTHLSKAAEFPSTTELFCCLLIESLSSSNGSVRISWVQRTDGLIGRRRKKQEGRQRDREMMRPGEKKKRGSSGALYTFMWAQGILRAAASLTVPSSHHMVWWTRCHLRPSYRHHRMMVVTYPGEYGKKVEFKANNFKTPFLQQRGHETV